MGLNERDTGFLYRVIKEWLAAILVLWFFTEIGLPYVGLIIFVAIRMCTRIRTEKDYEKGK